MAYQSINQSMFISDTWSIAKQLLNKLQKNTYRNIKES